MPKPITKLTKLNVPESFFQIDTFKGFKYVDRAGEIVNRYITEDRDNIEYSMTPLGMVILHPTTKIDAVQVTPTTIWAQFSATAIDSLDQIAHLFATEAQVIADIIDVSRVNRVGWRIYFAHEFPEQKDYDRYFAKLNPIPGSTAFALATAIETGRPFNAKLELKAISRADKEDVKGVLFDVDLYKPGPIEVSELLPTLKSFLDYLRDDGGFLAVVNGTFD